jgi:gliding motility-associated-like protein
VKNILIFSLFISSAAYAQSPCPSVQATSATPCSSTPVQLNATAGFNTYSWSPASGVSNPAIANPVANVTGTYTVTTTVLGPELVINGDFMLGNTGFTSGQTYSTTYAPGNYYVGAQWFVSWFPGLTDHTPTTDNMFMHVDGGNPATMLWEEANLPVQPNTNYTFTFWASQADQVQPIFDLYLIGNISGGQFTTQVGIPYTGTWTWDQYGVPLWNSGSNTSVTLRVVNLQTNGFGNDFGLDDFSFRTVCIDSDAVQITIAQPPNLGSDTSVCGSVTIPLNAGPANSYLWNTGDTTQNISVSVSGDYYVTATTNGCSFSDTIDVLITPFPVFDLGNDTTLCINEAIELDATAVNANTYVWNNGAQTSTLLANVTGTYSVVVSSGNCSSIDSIHLTVTEPLSLGDDIALCTVSNATLDAGNSTAQTFEINEAGEYWVTVNNGFCITGDTVHATGSFGEGMLFIPNTFTPTRNGINDKFFAYGAGIISFQMRIYDRWGQLIFETNDLNDGWDGMYKGRRVQEDTYVYVINYASECVGLEEKKVMGHVNVIR